MRTIKNPKTPTTCWAIRNSVTKEWLSRQRGGTAKGMPSLYWQKPGMNTIPSEWDWKRKVHVVKGDWEIVEFDIIEMNATAVPHEIARRK